MVKIVSTFGDRMLASDVDISMRFHLMDVSKRVCLLDFLREGNSRTAERRAAKPEDETGSARHEKTRDTAKDA